LNPNPSPPPSPPADLFGLETLPPPGRFGIEDRFQRCDSLTHLLGAHAELLERLSFIVGERALRALLTTVMQRDPERRDDNQKYDSRHEERHDDAVHSDS